VGVVGGGGLSFVPPQIEESNAVGMIEHLEILPCMMISPYKHKAKLDLHHSL
jgi:hypothetical protein